MDSPWRTKKRALPAPPRAPIRRPCFARRRVSGAVAKLDPELAAPSAPRAPTPASDVEPELVAFAAAMEHAGSGWPQAAEEAKEAADAMVDMATDKAVAEEAGVEEAAGTVVVGP